MIRKLVCLIQLRTAFQRYFLSNCKLPVKPKSSALGILLRNHKNMQEYTPSALRILWNGYGIFSNQGANSPIEGIMPYCSIILHQRRYRYRKNVQWKIIRRVYLISCLDSADRSTPFHLRFCQRILTLQTFEVILIVPISEREREENLFKVPTGFLFVFYPLFSLPILTPKTPKRRTRTLFADFQSPR